MPADDDRGPGLGAQFGRTRASFSRLLRAHVALARAEIGEIMGQLKMLATLAGVVFVLALLIGNLLYIGGFLFLGEWLFGSIGWGLAHGILFGLAVIAVLAMAILGAPWRTVLASFAIGLLVTIGLTVLLYSNVIHDALGAFAAGVVPPLNTAEAILALASALLFGLPVLLVLVVTRSFVAGIKGLLFSLIVLGVVSAVGGALGFVLASVWTLAPALGFAISFGLLVWTVLHLALTAPRLDPAERFARLKPRQSIEAANETRAWLEEQWRNRRPTPGRK